VDRNLQGLPAFGQLEALVVCACAGPFQRPLSPLGEWPDPSAREYYNQKGLPRAHRGQVGKRAKGGDFATNYHMSKIFRTLFIETSTARFV
jgi:hypothetical protein